MNNSIPRGVIFGFLSWLLPAALALITTPLVVRHLGAADYGIYVLVQGIISYTFGFGISRAVTKYVAEYYTASRLDRISEVLSATLILSLLVGIIGAVILTVSTNDLVTGVLHIESGLQNKAVASFHIGALTIVLWMTGQIFSAVLQAVGRFDLFSQITFVGSALQSIGNAFLAWNDYGVVVLLWWNLLTVVLTGTFFYLSARKLLPGFRLRVLPGREVFKLVGRFSLGVVAYQIISNLILIFERTWITRKLGAENLTFYVVPMMLSMYIHLFIGSLTLILFPLTSEVAAQSDKIRLLAIYRRTMKYVCLLVAFMGVTLAVASREFLTLWLGSEFADRSTIVFVFHIATYSLLAILIVTWQMIDGYGLPFYNALITVGFFLISVSLMVVLTEPFGIEGAAFARFASVLPIPIFILLVERRVFGNYLFEFWFHIVSKLAVAACACAAVEYFLPMRLSFGWFGLILSSLVGGLVFITALLMLNFLDDEERRWCGSFMRRAILARA